MRRTVVWVFSIALVATAKSLIAAEPPDAAFFESNVRPLLIAKCQECHTGEKPKAGLRLDSREAVLAGGESGTAAVAGKPDESLLIEVIGYRNALQMPPKAKLPDAEIAILTEWVRRGLPWPDSKSTVAAPSAKMASADFTEEQKSFWAFQPVKRDLPPPVRHSGWVRSPIDQYILADLKAQGLAPAREADRRTLIRRVTLDLTGLPPTPDEVTEFTSDTAVDALERLIDRLLASPRYGERWARHWLDVARYADSNGLDENLAYATAYRFRDYVVKAFREDKPYDRFLIEQIAGDLLPMESEHEGLNPGPDAFDGLVATGFLCLGAKMLAEDDPVKMQMDIIDEQVDTVSRAVMGLTMGCARCHDHKFDPITAEDYYGLAGVFRSTQTMDTFTVVARWHERPLATTQQLQQRDERQQLATTQKQVVDQMKIAAAEAILSQARQHPGAYLLAATRELQLAEQLKSAKPRGNEPNLRGLAGVILIEAEDYARGNVLKERSNYGKDIGVLVNRGEAPNFTEYDLDLKKPATYQFELRYAAAASRPVKVLVNGHLMKADAADKVTGSWTPESQTWFVEGFVTLNAGRNAVRLEQPTAFPHIDKLLLTPVDAVTIPGDQTAASKLIPSLVQQWAKELEASRSTPQSILTAWHQFIANKSLVADSSTSHNGLGRLLADARPTSLDQLSKRYEKLFVEAELAWQRLKATPEGKDAQALPDPVLEAFRSLLQDPKGPFAVPADIETTFSPETVDKLKVEREELSRREAAVPQFVETMAVVDSTPENLKIHLRGSHLTLGREVPRQLPRILAGEEPRTLTEGSGRLQLARWLADRDHPLTSRVMVNRIWQWHFGHGLVRSPDNFGRLGERPSHLALLDWLASEFSGNASTAEGQAWSIKAMHRRIVSSAAYRQSTEFDPNAALKDPENRLLWRFHRLRMDVEVLRDSLLAISDQLDETAGGTLLPTEDRAYVTSTENKNPAIYGSHRRSIYLPVVRSALFQLFTAFDFADPSTLAGQRDQTTVAPQALFMMNSEFVLEQSRMIAQRLLQRSDLDQSARLRQLYRLAYSRDPSEGEVSRAANYLDRIRDAMAQAGVAESDLDLRSWTSLSRAVLSANEFIYVE